MVYYIISCQHSEENIVSIMEAPSNYQNKLRKFIYLFIYLPSTWDN